MNKKHLKNSIFSVFALLFIVATIKIVFAASVNLKITSGTAPTATITLDQTVTYNVVIANSTTGGGATNTSGLKITLPTGVNVFDVTACTAASGASCPTPSETNFTISGNTVTFNSSYIVPAAGGTLTFTILGRPTSSGTLTNTVSVAAVNPDTETVGNLGDNTVTLASTTVNNSGQSAFDTCPGTGFFSRSGGGGIALSTLNVSTGAFTAIGSSATTYNATGFNSSDSFVYGVTAANPQHILRIDRNYNILDLGPINFNGFTLPTNATGNSGGEFDKNNQFYFYPHYTNQLYRIEMDRTSANFMKVVALTNLSFPAGYTTNGGTSGSNLGDLSLNPVDVSNSLPNYIYATGTDAAAGVIFRINPTTGAMVTITSGTPLPAHPFGGNFFGRSGTLYTVDNTAGDFYGVTFNAARTSYVITSIGPTGGSGYGNTDGARCPDAEDPIDLQIVKTSNVQTATVGQTVTFKLEVTNNGPQSSSDDTITDNVPANITVNSVNCTASGTSTCGTDSTVGNAVSLKTGFLTVGLANKITYTITGTANTAGGISNTATVNIPNIPEHRDSDTSNNTSSIVSTVKLSKAFSPSSIAPAGTSTLTFTLNNPPGSLYTGVGFIDTLPTSPGAMVVAGTPNIQTNCPAGGGTFSNLTSGTADSNGQTVTAAAGATAINVSNMKFNSGVTSCDVRVSVTAPTSGTYVNNSSRISGVSNIDATNVSATLGVGTSISGNVFEDVNYGGGVGRSLATSSGVGRPNVRVELYNSTGNFVSFTTTDASGNYSFTGLSAGSYTVRAVNNTVKSSRTGTSTELGVQTFRTNGLTANVGTADTNRVGGENPALVDAAANTTSATLASLTTASTIAESISTFTIASANVTGINFGFNFDTIVNKNDSGQGSLRQFILNSNLLGGEASLVQSGNTYNALTNTTASLPSGKETSIFMIPAGQLTSGIARITPSSAYPAISGTNTFLDGGTQTASIGNTNNTSLGDSSTVIGVGSTTLSAFNGPEVEINGSNSGFTISAANNEIDRIAIIKNGSSSGTAISLNGASTSKIQQVVIGGTSASSFAVGNQFATAISFTASNNLEINDSKIRATVNPITGGNSTGVKVQRNELTSDSGSAATGAAIDISIGSNTSGLSTMTIDRNYLYSAAYGILGDSSSSTGNQIINNTIKNNTNSGVVLTFGETNYIVTGNVITNNTGSGILIGGTSASGIKVSQNQFGTNGFNSIDLTNSTTASPDGVTINTACTNTGFANGGLGRPVINSATLIGGTLSVSGSMCSTGSYSVELYKATAVGLANATANNDYGTDSLPAGEGIAYIGNISATGGTFSSTFTGTGLAIGDNITAIVINNSGNNTSEFSANKTIALPTLSKSFNPTSIAPGGTSQLTLTLNNVAGNPVYTGISLTDTLPVAPGNMTIAGTPTLETNCPAGGSYTALTTGVADGNGQTVTGATGSGVLTLNGMKINSGVSSCNVRVNVTASTVGTYTNNTSRISGTANINVSVTAALTVSSGSANISGTVFEDKNYGGGAGRSLATSSGVGRPNVRVELYNSTGNFVSSATTNGSGVYTFTSISAGTYTVRAVNSTVKSSRTGTSTEVGVQTFRTNGLTSNVGTSDVNRVGGEKPELIDAASNTTSATLASLTTTTTTAESISTFTIGGTDVTGIDFGFNFDTIVNKNDSGQGSLRQFVVNSNLLGNAGLAQVGQSTGQEVSIFMIPNGLANPGQNVGYTNQLSSYGAAVITLASALPDITDANTSIDGSTQTKYVKTTVNGETNPIQVGSGTFVGVSQTYLPKFDAPEIELISSTDIVGVNGIGTAFQLKNVALAKVRTKISGNNSLIQDILMGMHADGTEDAGTTAGANYGIEVGGGSDTMTVRHNYVKVDNSGIRRDGSGSNMLIEYNEVTSPFTEQTATYDGILIIGAGQDDKIQYNYVHDIKGSGSELGYNPGSNVVNLFVQENTYDNNGKLKNGTPSMEPMNIDVRTIGSGSVLKIYRNIISNAGGMGVFVDATNRVWITQNSIFQNGKVTGKANLGIDLSDPDVDPNSLGSNLDGVNPNDGIANVTLAFSGRANSGTDYPIITSGTVKGTTLRIKGYVGTAPGQTVFGNATLEFFKADDDGNNNGPVVVADGKNVPHGEGKTYISSCLSASDGTFDCSFYNVNNVVPGDALTATATNTNFDTSEFSNLTVTTEDPFLFSPDNNSNALPGATVYYSHTVVSPVAGIVNLTTSSQKGWTYTFFNDVNGNGILDNGDTAYSGANPSLGDVYTLYPNHITKILVKLQIPEGTPENTVDAFKITATLTPSVPNSVPLVLSVTDTTTSSSLSSGVLKLIKTVDKTTVKSGQNLTYTITYTNTGNSVLSNISIEDVVPDGTTFVSVSVNGVYTASTKKLTWTIPGTLSQSQSSTVTFTVTVN